jgi:hypothetical protein
MTPDPVVRLQSVIHTLEHVIVPAVDATNLLAVEQCGVTLAQLQMLLAHLPLIEDYHRSCADDIAETVLALPEAAGGARTLAAASRLSGVAGADTRSGGDRLFYHDVGRAVDALLRAVAADGDAGYRAEVEKNIFAFSRRQSLRSRAWFRDSGFDPDPASLPPVSELIAPN